MINYLLIYGLISALALTHLTFLKAKTKNKNPYIFSVLAFFGGPLVLFALNYIKDGKTEQTDEVVEAEVTETQPA